MNFLKGEMGEGLLTTVREMSEEGLCIGSQVESGRAKGDEGEEGSKAGEIGPSEVVEREIVERAGRIIC